MAAPKLLATITVPTGGWDFAGDDGAAFTATLPAGDYDSILELGDALETAINAAAVNETFTVAVSSGGIVTITATGAWTVTWASTDDDLSALLGYAESESVDGSYILTATDRHLYAWYSPIGADYDLDDAWLPSREQETEAGGLIQYASSQEHTYRELRLALLGPECLSEGGTASDGHGASVDWTSRTLKDFWSYIATRPFRFYGDRADGTVASPGTEGTEYVTCRRMGDRWKPSRVDPDDWAYWRITIPLKVTGE